MTLELLAGLSSKTFDDLAEGLGDASGLTPLVDAQYSLTAAKIELIRRGVLVHSPDQSAPLAAALELLDRARDANRDVARTVVETPAVGAWVARTLAVLYGPTSEQGAARSLAHAWVVAAAAAVRAGIPFETTVPVYDGVVVLPTVGAIAAPDGAGRDTAALRSDGASLLLDGVPAGKPGDDGWLAPRRLNVSHDGLALSVELDDLDPYRTSDGLTAAGRLPDVTVTALREELAGAWSILVDRHRPYAEGIAAALRGLVLLDGYPANRGVSAAYRYAFGTVGLTMPPDAVSLAVTLVHETQHIKLNRVLELVDLHTSEGTRRYRAPWRDDPRPLEGLMHGAYAFAGVIDFWRGEREQLDGTHRATAEYEFARWRGGVVEVLDTIVDCGELTPAGDHFFRRLRDRVRPWLDDPVDPTAAGAADLAIRDDAACWRLRNHRVDRELVAERARRYRAGEEAPRPSPGFEVRVGATRREEHSRQDLVRLRAVDPDRFHRLAADPAALAAELPGATAADVAYASGSTEDAERLYRDRLAAGPAAAEIWAGLAMTLFRRDRPALLDNVELARAVHGEFRDHVDPEAIASWLATAGG